MRRSAVTFVPTVLIGLSVLTATRPAADASDSSLRCQPEGDLPVFAYELVRALPHDNEAYTQGLVAVDGWLYESTGLYGASDVRKIDLRTGKVTQSQALPARLFGEGLAITGDRLVQLTWQERVVRNYAIEDLRLLDEQNLDIEGWGLAFDGDSLIQSDGSADLYFRDPHNLRERRRVRVTAGDRPVADLNELEYVNGRVLANLFQTTCIAIIGPADGKVAGWLDISELAQRARGRWRESDVANGIAYDESTGTLYVTGKYWPELYEIRVEALARP